MSKGTNADPCPETHKSFRFSVKKDKSKKKKLNIILSSVVKELGPGNKDWFENTTALKIQQKKQKLENVDVSLCTPKDKICTNQLNASTSTSSESSENKFYFKIQRLLTSQTSTPSPTLPWQVPVLGGSPDVLSGSAPLCKQMDIRKSLGIDLNDSALSWTSSMATPTLMDSTFKGSPSPIIKQQKGLPRVLFSPGPSQTDEELHALENTSEDNTDDDYDDEQPFVPPIRRDSKSPATLISPDVSVFQNINQHEVFNTDSELSENIRRTDFEEKLNTRPRSSLNICKIPFTRNASGVTSEEASMPLFSQDLNMDNEIEQEQDIKKDTWCSPLGKSISKTTEDDDSETGVSETLSDFFDPPSSAVGRRRCAPRKGKKRKLLEDSLSFEVCNENVMSSTAQKSKKIKTDSLGSEDKKDDQSRTDSLKEEDKSMEEYKITVKSEEILEETHLTNLNIQQRKQSLSLSQEDASWENCSTPNNAKKTLKSILSSKKGEGSAVRSNKKVRFSVEEKLSLKRNLTQLENEECVSPDVFVQTLPPGDVNSGHLGSDSHTFTRVNSERDSAQNSLMSENIHTDKSTKSYSDVDVCDELFSQVSPRALNEMCSVATLVDRSSTTQKSNLVTEKNEPNTKLLADGKPVSVKIEDKKHVSSPVICDMKTEDDVRATHRVCEKEGSLPKIKQSNSGPTSLRGSIGLTVKPRKFLYPSTNQISKSCPKSVYGFAEQSEKNMKLTTNTNNSARKDPPKDTVLVQQSSTKLGLGENNIDKRQQDQSVLPREIHRNIGFESFSSLVNNGKLGMETDRSEVIENGNKSQPRALDGYSAKLVQTGNMAVKPNTELRGNADLEFHIKCEGNDVQSSKWNTPFLNGQQSEGHAKGVPLKTEPCNPDFSSSECFSQSSRPLNVKTKTTVLEEEKPNICKINNNNMLKKPIDSNQVILSETGEHKVNSMESESTSTSVNTSSPEPTHGNQLKHDPGATDFSGFFSASGKSLPFSEEKLHKARQLFVSLDCDTGIKDDSSLQLTDVDSLLKDKKMNGITGVENKHEMKLPRQTCSNSRIVLSNQAKTTTVSTPRSNIIGSDLQEESGSVRSSSADFEDMPEVSRLTPSKTMVGHARGFQNGKDEIDWSKNSMFEKAVSVIKNSMDDSNLNVKNVSSGLVNSMIKGYSEKHKDTEECFASGHTIRPCKGFTTAASKHLQLSNASLKKASVLLDNINTNYPSTGNSLLESVEEDKASVQEDCRDARNDNSVKDHLDISSAGKIPIKTTTVKFVEENIQVNNNDVKSTIDFDSDSSLEKVMSLFTEKDKEMDDRSSERMNGRIDMNSEDGKRHNIINSDSKKSGLLEKDRCQGIEDISLKRIDEMTGVKTAPGRKQKLSSLVLIKPVPCNGDSDMVETDTSKETLGGSIGNTAKLAGVSSVSGFGGFSTAGGKKLAVSDTSLKKAMSLVADVDVDVGDLKAVSEPDNSIVVMSTTSKSAIFSNASESGGFSTAGGKKLKVSDTSLKKAMSLIATIDNDTIYTSNRGVGHTESNLSTDSGTVWNKSTKSSTEDWLGGFNNVDKLGGFSTAGGKKLKLSENSMRKAMSIISEVEDTENRSLHDQCETSSYSASFGFQTAGGKHLQVSEASINKGISVMSEINAEVLKESVSFDKNSESVEYQKGREKPGNLGDVTDILNLPKWSESMTIKDKGFQTHTSRKSSSRFPPGANIPKGFRPFKPPKITKKLEIEKISDKQCVEGINEVPDGTMKQVTEETNCKHSVEVINKVVETTQTSKYSKVLSSSSDDKFNGEPHRTSFDTGEVSIRDIPEISKRDNVELQTVQSDTLKGSIRYIPKVSKKDDVELAAINVDNIKGCINHTSQVPKGNKVQSQGSSIDNQRDILPVLKEDKADQDIEPSIMDEMFSEELESSQHFSPGSGKILRSQKGSTTPGKQDQRTDVLPSEEYEFLDIEDMVLCEAVESKCKSLGSPTSKTIKEKYPVESVKIGDKSVSPVQCDRSVALKTQSPVQHNGFSLFQSASGKNISVSEEAVRKAKQNQKDWCIKSKQEHSEQQTEYSGFQGSSGKKDSISESVLSKAKRTTDHCRAKNNDLTEIEDKVVETIVNSKSRSGEGFEVSVKHKSSADQHTEFGGFQSASGKKVQVSEEALTEARQNVRDWCSDIGEEPLHEKAATIQKDCHNQELFPEFTGFQSASGKKVFVSSDALVKARQNIRDWCSDVGEEPLHEKAATIQKDCHNQELFPEFTGFQSASGKKVIVSNDALVKARQNIRDWSSELNIHQSNEMESSTTSGDGDMDSKGDKSCVTPSNKDICGDVSFSGDNNEVKEEEWTVPKLCFVGPLGKTVKSNLVKISREEKMEHGLCVQNDHLSVQEVMNSQYDFSQDESNNDAEVLETEETKFQHISDTVTALMKEVNVSENAIEHSRKTLEDVGNSPFQSASGKNVSISQNAIKQVRQTMGEVSSSPLQSSSDKKMNCFDDAFQHSKNNMEELENSPFQSALGKKVNITKSALQHARKTMEDIINFNFQSGSENLLDMPSEPTDKVKERVTGNLPSVMNREPKIIVGENSISLNSPFQTATGSKISISETSLKHVRKTTAKWESSSNVADEDRKSLSCNTQACSVEKAELTKLDKGPRLRYQITKAVSTVREKQSSHSTCDENLITPLKQEQYGGPIPPSHCQQSTGFSPCIMGNTDRQVFIKGMNHSFDEFCQPDDFLEEMEVTPKRRRVEEKAGISRSGMVKPMKCVPEAFTRDRQGTSCSFRARHSTSNKSQESVSRSGVSVLTPSSNIKPQAPVKSSFLTPYKKPDTSKSDTDNTNPQTCSSNQAAGRPTPKFIPKCLSTNQSDIVKSKTPACTSVQENLSENEIENKEEKSVKLDMLELLEGARKHQAELLKAKEKTKINPDPGRLYTVKKDNIRLKMRDVIKLHSRYVGRSQQHHPRPKIGNVGAATAVRHKFYLPDFYTNFQGYVFVGDGAYLVPDDKLYAGKDELFRAFSTLAGVDCRLITDLWFYNHYRWMVWKLAAYEVTSPHNFAGRALTPEVIMLQMKYRYDREIDNCHRSALKKIMERDDTSSKRMVLCVCGINRPSQSDPTDINSKQADRGDKQTLTATSKLADRTDKQTSVTSKQPLSNNKLDPQVCVELTDGWYSIAARLDVPLSDLVSKHRIRVGDKLCLSGAELEGPQDACTPLEAPASLMLKLYANSTRPAPWDAQLGYQSDPRPLCISLSSLYGEGGAVGCLDVVLARKYPQMYMEKLSEGGCVFRTALAEDKFQQQHQQHRQEEMEKLYAKLQSEFESEDSKEKCISKKKWTKKEVELMQTGHEIYEAYSTSRQPDMIEEYLSDRQRELLMERRRQVQDEKQQKLHAEFQKTWQKTSERTVIPLVKMKFVGCSRKDMDSKASTTVTVWRPTQDVRELTEGTRYKIFGLNASSSRSRFKQCDVQLTATRQTRFMPVTIDENLLDMVYEPREVLGVRDIKYRQPLYGEADFVGMVVSVSTLNFAESGRHQDVVYAVDVNGSILGIKFWGGLKSFSLEDVLCEGKLFCASNLMDKSVYRSSILPLLEANLECSAISQTSQYPAQRRALDKLKSVSMGTHGFLETAKEHLSALQQQKKENTKKFTPEKNLKQETEDPLDSVLKTPDEGKPSNSSSTTSMVEGSMPAITGKLTYQARMAQLLNFGSPAPLSPLVSNTNRSVNKGFKPPVLRRKSLGPNH